MGDKPQLDAIDREWLAFGESGGQIVDPDDWMEVGEPLDDLFARLIRKQVHGFRTFWIEHADRPYLEQIIHVDPELASPSEDFAETFRELASTWKKETVVESNITRRVMHWAYQQIIGLGSAALPLLFRELEDEPAYWFWALAAITREDPAAAESTFEGARAKWLEWGRQHGYLQ